MKSYDHLLVLESDVSANVTSVLLGKKKVYQQFQRRYKSIKDTVLTFVW